MKQRKPHILKKLSMALIAFMVFMSVTPAFAAGGTESNNQLLQGNETQPENKISNRLMETFDEKEKATFLIKLKEKGDLQKVVEESEKNAKKNQLSNQQAEFNQHSAVISELKVTADSAQGDVLNYLESEEENGNAEVLASYFIVNGIAVNATEEVAEKIASFAEVEKIIPNETRELMETETSKEPSNQKSDDAIEWNVDRVNAPKVWEKGFDGSGVVVASIDTGAEWDHPALKEKYRGYDSETGEVNHDFNWYDATVGEDEPYDDVGHGTHVTGTMVGGEPDGSNQVGVAPGAKWISVKAFDNVGGTDADLLNAAEWILAPTDSEGNTDINMAPDVVNNSWGGGPGLDEWYRDVVISWRAAGIFPEFSAGNITIENPGGPGSVAAPANYPESFATGNTDVDDEVVESSLRGPSPYDEIKPDIAAPGTDIRSAQPGGDYQLMSGTSMAGPAVSGVVALLLQGESDLDVDEIEDILMHSANPLTDDTYPETPNNGYGAGLVDAYNAVVSVTEGLGTVEGTVVSENEDKKIRAEVSIADGDRSTKTKPSDNSYRLMYDVGEFTIEAGAYGHETASKTVELEKNETTTADFVLDELPKGTVTGVVRNENTDNVIEEATIYLIEDGNIEPVQTDEVGNYNLEAYTGSYTLRVTAHQYHTKDVDVTIEDGEIKQNVNLKPYYTYPGGEIGYDDGTADIGIAPYMEGDGYGVKMTLPEGMDEAIIKSGKFMFRDETFPNPGDTPFLVEVWDATGEDGLPGEKIAGPFDAEAIRDGETWTEVDLWEHDITVEEDFYMVYVNKSAVPYVPGMALDQGGFFSARNVQFNDGEWTETFADTGNFMIRSVIDYEVQSPTIQKPEEDIVTNEKELQVQGTASPSTEIALESNGETVDSVDVTDDGEYALDTTLAEGENALQVISSRDGDSFAESDKLTAVLDMTNPELTIDQPESESITNKEVAVVKGTVSDNYEVDTVKANGKEADVTEQGDYSIRVPLEEGKNEIEVIAKDKAGNTASETVEVEKKTDAPTMDNVKPSKDKYVFLGDKVVISFESDTEDGDASYQLNIPGMKNTSAMKNNMKEVEPGLYKATWTVPEDLNMNEINIQLNLTDKLGNKTTEKAAGKLFVSQEKIDRIAGDIRYDTAVEISKSGWSEADTVILARGDNYADSLAGVPLAHQLDAPILLTPTDYVWENTLNEIERLGAENVIVLGGENAVHPSVVSELDKAGLDTRRIEGETRFETAANIASEIAPDGAKEAVVVNGLDFPDAMTVASYAADAGQPILLTLDDKLPDATEKAMDDLQVKETVIAGGTKVVGKTVENQLPAPTRLDGHDRYDTNIAVAEHYGLDSDQVYVATGKEYADALTGAVLAAKQDSGIVLVHDRVPETVSNYLKANETKKLSLFGGDKAISDQVKEALSKLVE